MPSYIDQQFFKPTGFSRKFTVDKFESLGHLPTSHRANIDDAVRYVSEEKDKADAVAISLEPGSGKTTVFPFRFAFVKVCVILPTGFDTLAAFRLASGKANIDTGRIKEDHGSNVTYLDSFTAGLYLFKHRRDFPFKVVIIDESDSSAGITKALTELKIPGVFVVHISGTPEGRKTLETSGFGVEVFDTLPELTDDYFEAVEFIKSRSSTGRNLVMVPNARVAQRIHAMIKNSRRIDCDMTVEELDSLIKDQTKSEVIVADDSCSRGFNLNLDKVFDFQLVGEGDGSRATTEHERVQRRMRVGRLKNGVYFCTRRDHASSSFSRFDVFRNNVARAVFGTPLEPCDLSLDHGKLQDLMVSKIEPYELQRSLPSLVAGPARPASVVSGSQRTGRRGSTTTKAPDWMLWVTGFQGKTGQNAKRTSSHLSTHSRHSHSGSGGSSSGSSLEPGNSVSVVGSPPQRKSTVCTVPSTSFGLGEDAGKVKQQVMRFDAPVIDLSLASSPDWPNALRAAYNGGEQLLMVKPGEWMFTGMSSGVDYVQRLLAIIREGPSYTPAEFEVVCRSWNVMVSRTGYSFAKGRDAWGDGDRVTFILDYFSAYNSIVLS